MRFSLFSRYTCFVLCILIFIVSLFYLHHVEGMLSWKRANRVTRLSMRGRW